MNHLWEPAVRAVLSGKPASLLDLSNEDELAF
jgi:hypothetical protein